MDERMLLIGEYLKGERAMAELCREFGVSRKTAYKWVGRYKEDGPAGLADKSRAPLSHPARLDTIVVEALLEARRAHPHWGARKILAWLGRREPRFASPAASTVSAIFAKYGLSRTRQARRRTPPYTDPFSDAGLPNDLWCADFKGDFRTGDGRRCYPLTMTDACSRMLLRCTALASTKTVGVSVATKFEGTRIKKTEGRGGSEQRVVPVRLAHDGVDDASIDAQCAA
jgi:putative transposase